MNANNEVLVFWWSPQRPTDPAPPAGNVDTTIFGTTSSVRDYYLQNSGGNYTIERAGVLGWFTASRPAAYWWGPPDTNDSDGDGWVNPHVQKWAEAIRMADPLFNYKAFDANPFDGNLRPEDWVS